MINDIKLLNLKINPFNLTPSIESELVWAGMPLQKKQIEDVYKKAFLQNGHQIVLNWGPVGGGKTFAAYYFFKKHPISPEEGECIQAYVRTPKEGVKANINLIRSIIDAFTLSEIRRIVKEAVNLVGLESLFDNIFSKIKSEEFTYAILKLAEDDVTTINTMTSMIFGTATSSELKKINLFRPLKEDNDYIKFLSGIIICMTISPIKPKRVFIWINEMEDLVYYSSKQFKQFSQAIRDLVDTTNEKFTLMLNFTLSEGEDETVKMLLGEALWSRIDSNIRFKDLNVSDGLQYSKDLLSNFQYNELSEKYLPFSEDVLEVIINDLPSSLITPREINKILNKILYYAMSNDKTIIDKTVLLDYEINA